MLPKTSLAAALRRASAWVLVAVAAHAAGSEQPDVGVRAIAMGGAGVAAGAEAASLRLNPATIASLQRQEVSLSYADRYGLGLGQSYMAYVLPVTDNHALAVDWYHRGYDDVSGGLGLQSSDNAFGFAYGYRNSLPWLRPLLGNAAVGLSGRYVSLDTQLDGASVMSATGLGLDAGLLVPLPWGLRLGAAVQDLGGTSVQHSGGLSEQVYSSRWRIGLAHKPIEGLTLAADLDDYARVGAEYWLLGQVALRAGLRTELDSPDERGDATAASFGLGLKYRFLRLDYAYEQHPVLSPTHYTSVSLAYNPRVITIKDATVRPSPVFYSLYPHYQEGDFFDVVLSNSAPEPIEVTVGLFLPKAMSVPHQERLVLPAQSTEKYAFTVTFDPDLFNQPEARFDHFVTPVVTVSYTRDRQPQTVEKQLERVYLAGKGKVSWNVPGMAAAFVTPSDLAVAGFARGLVQRYDRLLAAKFNRSSIGKAAVLFDALGVYRVAYQADSKTPFASIADDRTIFDTVQYPSELLAKTAGEESKVGDCDDLTVLFASLLENLSIDTAFLEANDPGKGHIYLMFDSGVAPDRAEDHFAGTSEYVEWEGRIWIPVETTMYGFTFGDAWRNGVAEYKRLKARGLINEVYVQEWLQTYKAPVLPPTLAELPAAAAMDSLLSRDVAFFDQRTDQIARASVTSLETADGAYDAGAAYLRANHLEKAAAMFERALSLDPGYVDAINATGVVLTMQGRYDEALENYRRALALRDENGIRMNVALTYYLKGERDTADRIFEEVVAVDESYGQLFDFLASVGDAAEYYDIGISYLRQLRLDQAREQLDLALEADPQFADAVNARGVVAARQGQYDEALKLFQQAARLDPGQLGFQLNVALAEHLRGNHQQADVLYRQVVARDAAYEGLFDFLEAAESAEESYRLAVGYLQQGEYEKALEKCDLALRADPGLADAYNTKGVVLTRLGQYDAAFGMFERAEELMPTNPGIRLNMAIVRHLQGRRHEAAFIYRQVIEMDARYQGFLDFLTEE
ncbi:MAG: tetratricopeptide repeat protein [Gemmatimonadota bacterium]